MEEEQKWRIKKCCCCMPLRSGTLCLAYFNAAVIILLPLIAEYENNIDFFFMIFGISRDIDGPYYMHAIALILDFIFALVLIYALHTNNAALLLAYMSYVVVNISCYLLIFVSFFIYNGFNIIADIVLIGADIIYYVYILLLVYSVRLEIKLEKMDLLSPPRQASEVILQPTAPLAQPEKMADDSEKTFL